MTDGAYTQRPIPDVPEVDPPGDYSYDLAHEPAASDSADRPRSQAPRREAPVREVDDTGDYSYDLAHDVPETRR